MSGTLAQEFDPAGDSHFHQALLCKTPLPNHKPLICLVPCLWIYVDLVNIHAMMCIVTI